MSPVESLTSSLYLTKAPTEQCTLDGIPIPDKIDILGYVRVGPKVDLDGRATDDLDWMP